MGRRRETGGKRERAAAQEFTNRQYLELANDPAIRVVAPDGSVFVPYLGEGWTPDGTMPVPRLPQDRRARFPLWVRLDRQKLTESTEEGDGYGGDGEDHR